jgi:hypothetical protein
LLVWRGRAVHWQPDYFLLENLLDIVTEEQEVCNWSISREAGSVLISHHAPQYGQFAEQLIQIKTGD